MSASGSKETSEPAPEAAEVRLRRFLRGPIGPLLLRLALPNTVVVMAQSLTVIADVWFVGQLGSVTALAAIGLVYPMQALMQMMSAGAMGGGVSSAVARALGSGLRDRAEVIMMHALLIALGMASLYVLIAGVLSRPVFGALGGEGAVLDGAVAFATFAFGGAASMWLANTLASVLRGTGDMLTPGIILVLASLLQIGLSGAFTLGWGPFPAMGVAGPGVALCTAFSCAALAMAIYVATGRGGIRFRVRGLRLQGSLFRDILKVGAPACANAFLTVATIFIVTRMVATEGAAALAGYGLGNRLELLMVPIVFGVGAALTASVGTNFGAEQFPRARRIAWTGGLFAAAVTGLIGVATAVHPPLWLAHFTTDPDVAAIGTDYLRTVGPFFGFFGLGMALYFASQGTGNMVWPLTAGAARLLVVAGGGSVVLSSTASGLQGLLICVAAGHVYFGLIIAMSLFSGVWNPERKRRRAAG